MERTFASYAPELITLSSLMHQLLDDADQVPRLRIEEMAECELTVLENDSILYWTQYADSCTFFPISRSGLPTNSPDLAQLSVSDSQPEPTEAMAAENLLSGQRIPTAVDSSDSHCSSSAHDAANAFADIRFDEIMLADSTKPEHLFAGSSRLEPHQSEEVTFESFLAHEPFGSEGVPFPSLELEPRNMDIDS